MYTCRGMVILIPRPRFYLLQIHRKTFCRSSEISFWLINYSQNTMKLRTGAHDWTKTLRPCKTCRRTIRAYMFCFLYRAYVLAWILRAVAWEVRLILVIWCVKFEENTDEYIKGQPLSLPSENLAVCLLRGVTLKCMTGFRLTITALQRHHNHPGGCLAGPIEP